jgi:hypothetical protein
MSMVMLDLDDFILYYSITGGILNGFQSENTRINNNYFRLLRRDAEANSEKKKIQHRSGGSGLRYESVLMKADEPKIRNGHYRTSATLKKGLIYGQTSMEVTSVTAD